MNITDRLVRRFEAFVRFKTADPPGGTPPATPAAGDPPAAAAPAAPPGITREEFDTVKNTLTAVNETLTQFRALLTQPPPQPQGQPAQEVSPEQYEEAVRSGDGQTARRYIDQERQKDRNAMEARVGQIEQMGTESLASVVELTAIAGLPHYKTYEKEIKQIIAGMPPAGRINPQAQRRAYDMVIGAHMDTIIVAEREKALRQTTAPDAASAPGASGPSRQVGAPSSSETPSPRDLGGDEAESALALVGRDSDRTAQGLGYKNWKDYMEKTKEYR